MTYLAYVDQYGWFLIVNQGANPMILTPALCRAARGLLDWTQSDIAGKAGVSRSTIRDYEGGHHDIHRATEAQLRLAFEEGGVVFAEMQELGWGVYLRRASHHD
ncbi:helix-turn-helix domain-containing protein [Rhizobium mayense]|uniref:Helix-turn-helix transcriptional regulator n=1 Tax=Rhizobium mayense TaxID=1312184 RepID=A0ABT7JYK2_9HYPH|nr:helix-turn-helix transcriptional regulator [Rhizobium mayense]MDL2401413.1 helix-turn-helix transcriptional regulator [Rhizobium mayense]